MKTRPRRSYPIGSKEFFDRGWKRLRYRNTKCRWMSLKGQSGKAQSEHKIFRFPPNSDRLCRHSKIVAQCHVWTAPAVQGKNLTFQRAGRVAAMYTAFECSRCGRWP